MSSGKEKHCEENFKRNEPVKLFSATNSGKSSFSLDRDGQKPRHTRSTQRSTAFLFHCRSLLKSLEWYGSCGDTCCLSVCACCLCGVEDQSVLWFHSIKKDRRSKSRCKRFCLTASYKERLFGAWGMWWWWGVARQMAGKQNVALIDTQLSGWKRTDKSQGVLGLCLSPSILPNPRALLLSQYCHRLNFCPQQVDWGYYGNKNNPKVPLQESNLIQNRASDLTSCKTSNRWRAQENTVTKDRIVGSL